MDLSRKIPKYEQVRRKIEEYIRSGRYRHGDFLPSEDELCSHFKTGRNTIRHAVADLSDSGLIMKQQGRVSRINFPTAVPRQPAKRLAWFNYASPDSFAGNEIYFDMFRNAVALAARHGIQVDFLSTHEENCWQLYQDNREWYIGALAVGLNRNCLSKRMFERLDSIQNLIAIDETDDYPGRFCVTTDNFESARIGTQYLVNSGCRHPAFFSLATTSPVYHPFLERKRGFEAVLKDAGHNMALQHVYFAKCGPSLLSYRDIKTYFPEMKKFDGIFATTDHLALAIIQALQHEGLRVPEDVAVMGFDGLPAGQYHTPRLTTVRQPSEEIVETAIDLALKLNDKPEMSGQRIRLVGQIIKGESVNPPRNSANRD